MMTIHECDDILAFSNSFTFQNISNYKYLAVTFSARNGAAFGYNYFTSRSIPAIFISCKKNNWWHSEATIKVLDIIKEIANKSGYEIITYGSSMGGYACIHFSQYLQSSKSVAIAPQSILEPKKTIDNRWDQETSSISYLFDEEIRISKNKVLTYVFFDNFDALDKYHAESLIGGNFKLIQCPYCTHSVARSLSKDNLFSSFLLSLFRGEEANDAEMEKYFSEIYKNDRKAFLNSIRTRTPEEIQHELEILNEIYARKESLDFEESYMLAEAFYKANYLSQSLTVSLDSITNYKKKAIPEYLILKHALILRAYMRTQ